MAQAGACKAPHAGSIPAVAFMIWQVIGLAFIILVVAGPLLIVLLLGITSNDDT